ncbi:hypothetical protein [Methylobacterium nodulans]|uniref:Uncharacterized protein n=1 Tax=Methylobacterium nodulans (strain LMG 21967 / CNCM I-2342 / ORS 2060) TaxID=460265 RepID=B8IY30_METNO|nr:hypothetical protein [Methylobacterium nodulans]ACL63320.1 hypothetical protein Mnod_7727 [Methylobacterium nodulans ORS 2060]
MAVLDGNEAIVADANEVERIEAVAGSSNGRLLAVLLYGVVTSRSALVDAGGVPMMLERGRAWSGPGRVEVREPVDRADLPDLVADTLARAWGRLADQDVANALAGRGWQSLRVVVNATR